MDVSVFDPKHLDADRLLANLEDAKRNVEMYEIAASSDGDEKVYWLEQAAETREEIVMLERLLTIAQEHAVKG